MPTYVNKETGATINIGEDDVLPGAESDWESGDASPKRRRKTDTGSIPTQNDK